MSDENELDLEGPEYYPPNPDAPEASEELDGLPTDLDEVDLSGEVDAAPDPEREPAEGEEDERLYTQEEFSRVRDGILGDLRGSRRETQQLREQIARMEERFAPFVEYYHQQTQPPPPELPDPEEDPVGHIAALQQMTSQEIQAFRQEQQDRANAELHQRQEQQFVGAVTAAVQQFETQHPDYKEALSFAIESRATQLLPMMQGDRQAAGAYAAQELQKYGIRAAYAGMNPAQAIYEWAGSLGYQPAEEGAEAAEPANGNGNGAQPQPTGAPRARGSLRERREARQGASSVGGAAGRAADGQSIVQRVAAMDDEEYNDYASRLRGPDAEDRLLRAALRKYEA